MSIITREVKNKKSADGTRTGKAGIVYDVSLKYKTPEGFKSYGKRGFLSRSEALQHEAAMRMKFARDNGNLTELEASRQLFKDYLESWISRHGTQNLRPSTLAGYNNHINAYIVPNIGELPLCQITPAVLDSLYEKLLAQSLAVSTVRYTHRVISVALEHACQYGYLERNSARHVITSFRNQAATPEPYSIPEMQQILCYAVNTEWEMIILLAGLYGLRRSEITGLRWQNVDLKLGVLKVVEQQPFEVENGTTIITEMVPTKSAGRILPITPSTKRYFEHQLVAQKRQQKLCEMAGLSYYENNLVVSLPNGAPICSEHVSTTFASQLRKWALRHIRFHDLRHSAATNMHDLTGDFYTVSEILGHTTEGTRLSLGLPRQISNVTERYIHIHLSRKLEVLNAYHQAVLEGVKNMQ